MWPRQTWILATLGPLAVAPLASACTDTGKLSETKATEHVEKLVKTADDDVDQVRRGLPRGAKALGQIYEAKDAVPEPMTLRRTMEKVRNDERDLEIAKSTFFALADQQGNVVRSDLEPDPLAGKNLLAAFPDLKKAYSGEFVETFGSMPELAGTRTGPDAQWLAAAPIRDGVGAVRAVYATGWSWKRFSYHLEEALKHDLVEEVRAKGLPPSKLPLLYVFVFTAGKVYGAPLTPAVDVEALEKLDLPSHTANDATFHQQLEITDRKFGVAARRVIKLGPNAGVAVLRSEI